MRFRHSDVAGGPDPVGRGRNGAGPSRIAVILGGHEFSRRRGNEALRDYLLDLADVEDPQICLLPTASGDAEAQIHAFRQSLGSLPCRPSNLSLFRLEGERMALREHLLQQDIIYVGGGSMRNLLAIWRAHGIDRILREAWEAGTILCGQSAGAMCWFEWGISRSSGAAQPVRGLGFLPGSLSVHYHRDPDRRRVFHQAVALVIPPGYGVDDGAGLLFRGEELAEVVRARPGAGAWRVESAGGGAWKETVLPARELVDPRPAIDEQDEAVTELRRTVASRVGGGLTAR
jgi:dipeptidase E